MSLLLVPPMPLESLVPPVPLVPLLPLSLTLLTTSSKETATSGVHFWAYHDE